MDRLRLLTPVVTVEDGRKLLRVGGVIQSAHVDAAYAPDVWDALVPEERPESVLILGLGGGTVAHLLTARHGPLRIVGVEVNPAVIRLARREFGLERLGHLEIVHEDAFAYVRRADERFGAICVDLYTAGKLAHGTLSASFLRDLRRLLAPGGIIRFNLWRSPFLNDQLRRIGRSLPIRATNEVDDNIIVTCVLDHA